MSGAEIREEAEAFQQTFASLMLGSCSVDGQPHVSYAPYVRDMEGAFYVYISELAQHTGHLQANPRASIMLIADEAATENMHARKRVTWQCRVEEIQRGDAVFPVIMDQMQEVHGDVVQMLRQLEDFHLFRLIPEDGRYVRGFAQAYRLEGIQGQPATPVRDRGHGRSESGS